MIEEITLTHFPEEDHNSLRELTSEQHSSPITEKTGEVQERAIRTYIREIYHNNVDYKNKNSKLKIQISLYHLRDNSYWLGIYHTGGKPNTLEAISMLKPYKSSFGKISCFGQGAKDAGYALSQSNSGIYQEICDFFPPFNGSERPDKFKAPTPEEMRKIIASLQEELKTKTLEETNYYANEIRIINEYMEYLMTQDCFYNPASHYFSICGHSEPTNRQLLGIDIIQCHDVIKEIMEINCGLRRKHNIGKLDENENYKTMSQRTIQVFDVLADIDMTNEKTKDEFVVKTLIGGYMIDPSYTEFASYQKEIEAAKTHELLKKILEKHKNYENMYSYLEKKGKLSKTENDRGVKVYKSDRVKKDDDKEDTDYYVKNYQGGAIYSPYLAKTISKGAYRYEKEPINTFAENLSEFSTLLYGLEKEIGDDLEIDHRRAKFFLKLTIIDVKYKNEKNDAHPPFLDTNSMFSLKNEHRLTANAFITRCFAALNKSDKSKLYEYAKNVMVTRKSKFKGKEFNVETDNTMKADIIAFIRTKKGWIESLLTDKCDTLTFKDENGNEIINEGIEIKDGKITYSDTKYSTDMKKVIYFILRKRNTEEYLIPEVTDTNSIKGMAAVKREQSLIIEKGDSTTLDIKEDIPKYKNVDIWKMIINPPQELINPKDTQHGAKPIFNPVNLNKWRLLKAAHRIPDTFLYINVKGTKKRIRLPRLNIEFAPKTKIKYKPEEEITFEKVHPKLGLYTDRPDLRKLSICEMRGPVQIYNSAHHGVQKIMHDNFERDNEKANSALGRIVKDVKLSTNLVQSDGCFAINADSRNPTKLEMDDDETYGTGNGSEMVYCIFASAIFEKSLVDGGKKSEFIKSLKNKEEAEDLLKQFQDDIKQYEPA